MLGYGGHCPWVVSASVAMAAFSAFSTLALSSPSPHFTLLVLPQMFFWWCLRQLMGNEKNQVFFCNNGAWRSVSHLGKELSLFASSSVLKRGGKESITWVFLSFPFFLDFSGEFPSPFWITPASSTSWQQMWVWGQVGRIAFWSQLMAQGHCFLFPATANHWAWLFPWALKTKFEALGLI